NYSAAKAGIVGVTKTIAKEWGRFNIQANAVCYGFIETRLTAPKESGETTQRAGVDVALGVPDAMRQMAPMLIPLGRPGTPEEAAGPMLFLASPLSDYVSGHVLEITGGRAVKKNDELLAEQQEEGHSGRSRPLCPSSCCSASSSSCEDY